MWNEENAVVGSQFFLARLRVTLLVRSGPSEQNFRRPQTSLKCKNTYFLKVEFGFCAGAEIT